MQRREYMGGLAGLGLLSLAGGASGAENSSYHPGPPRFLHVGEALQDPLGNTGKDRTALAPRLSDPEREPDTYAGETFTWSIVDAPESSDAALAYDATTDFPPEYDAGRHNVAEFAPDEPGVYTVEVDAPDGTNELTVRAFPEPTTDGGRPRCQLSGEFDAGAGEFVVEAETVAAPDSDRADEEIGAEFHPDDRSPLTRAALDVSGTTARIPASELDGPTRIHAVGVGDRHSVADVALLDPEEGAVRLPNRAPEWIKNATVYEIFTRSFGSEAGEADFGFLESNVEYLDDLGVDAVWLTPICKAYTHRNPNEPGGPHGYDIENFFRPANALGTLAEFESFVETCHDHDIKVIFDLVANHTGETHHIARHANNFGPNSPYYDWFKRREDGQRDDYFGWDLRVLNYENMAVREHMLAIVDFWSDIVDGFRCDVAWGVQHSFWKEVRTLVKAKDPEFLLLDETIPYDADYDESEFDMHFDTTLNWWLRQVGEGNNDASKVFATLSDRQTGGFPEHSVFLQYIENHDMRRYLDLADESDQRAAAAATFTLPGVPMLYYGQERALTNYSDPRIDEKGHFRAFMNWEEYDRDHLDFYTSLVEARGSIPALDHDAAIERLDTDSDNVVAFARDASYLDIPGGPQRVVVVLNFGGSAGTVRLDASIGTTDLLHETDIGVDGAGSDETTVAVDEVAILPDTSVPDKPERSDDPSEMPGPLDSERLRGTDYDDLESLLELFGEFAGS